MSVFNRSGEKRRLEELQHQDQEVIGSLCRLSNRPISPKSQMEQEKRIRREIANSNERRRMQSINAGFQSLRTLLPHHEGEKLSKAAILQQTAEYIYQLEQEKTRLLSQNCQLKRLLNQHEGEASNTKKRKTDGGAVAIVDEGCETSKSAVRGNWENIAAPLVKESPLHYAGDVEGYVNNIAEPVLPRIARNKNCEQQPCHPGVVVCVNESSDEGIGSMSPEPLDDHGPELLRREMIELRVQLDRERRLRMQLEDQVRSLESQLYPERIREITQQVQLQYHHHNEQPVIEHTPRREPAVTNAKQDVFVKQEGLKVLPAAVTTVATTSAPIHSSPPLHVSPIPSPVLETISVSTSPAPIMITERSSTPVLLPDRLPSVLEAAIKAEPKVEVEPAPRVPTPTQHTATANEDASPLSSLYPASRSRQNLETIVEAIRHLEGDHLFNDDLPHSQNSPQDAPLALTTSSSRVTTSSSSAPTQQQMGTTSLLKVEVNPIDLGYRALSTSSSSTSIVTASSQSHIALASSLQHHQQVRPGVIVVKHS